MFSLLLATCAILSLQKVRAGPVATPSDSQSRSNCRYLPGDANWPSLRDWANLNSTVEGRLIQTVPLAAPCHDPTYNQAVCTQYLASWAFPTYHEGDPTSIVAPFFTNDSCDPYTAKSSPCSIGNLPDYSINVTSWQDAAAGISFAQKRNIRLVIKNTGHDFLGKSTGKGSLNLWTHNLNSINFIDYASNSFTGKAVKIGAGVRGFEVYEAAAAHDLIVVGGDCPSVGLAGGFTQGGGHSFLSSLYGLGADQVLEWEVVTAQGQRLVATPTQNQDLYWALSGGGPGTYGVVVSLTVRTHAAGIFGGASLGFASAGISNTTYWDAIAYWQSLQASLVDAGATTIAIVRASGFQIAPFTAPGATVNQTATLLAPFTDYLTAHNISYSLNVTSLPFLNHYEKYLGPFPFGTFPAALLIGGRLIPRSVVGNQNAALTSAFRTIIENSSFYVAITSLNAGHPLRQAPVAPNAVLPAWRDALFTVIVASLWDFTAPRTTEVERENYLTHVIDPALEALTPGSGAYLNEANFQDPNWKRNFYGPNYDRLRAVKEKYDGDDLFYATTAVGSDAWAVATDGRLCRAN